MIIDRIVVQTSPPRQRNVLWAKIVGDGFTFYIFNNGYWQPMRLMNDEGTLTTDDDTVEDISKIGDTITEEVSKQIETLEEGMVNSQDSTDGKEYPDVQMGMGK